MIFVSGFVAFLALAGVVFVVASGTERDRSFIRQTDDNVSFLRWTQDRDGRLTGELRSVYSGEDFEPDETIYSITGNVNGDWVQITTTTSDMATEWVGDIEGDRLNLRISGQDGPEQVYEAASEGDFTAATEEFREELASREEEFERNQQEAAEEERLQAEAEAQQYAVEDADATLTETLEGIDGTSESFEDDYAATLDDVVYDLEEETEGLVDAMETLRSYEGGLNDAIADGSCVSDWQSDYNEYEESNFRSDLDSFYSSRESVEDYVDTVEDARSNLQQMIDNAREYLDDLNSAVEANESGIPVPRNSTEGVEAEISRAEEYVVDADAAIQDANANITAFDEELPGLEANVDGLQEQAEANCD